MVSKLIVLQGAALVIFRNMYFIVYYCILNTTKQTSKKTILLVIL